MNADKRQGIKRSDVWNNIYEVLARLDLKESNGEDQLDKPSAAVEIEDVFNQLAKGKDDEIKRLNAVINASLTDSNLTEKE